MSGAGPLVPPAGLTVAIPTYRRPGAVARALRAVLAEAGACREDGAGPGGPVEVLVIDNDPDGSAREAVATAAGGALGAGSARDAGAGPGADLAESGRSCGGRWRTRRSSRLLHPG